MIIGDPYKFAFIIDEVSEWSNGSFRNGIFFVVINGILFPSEVENCTLNSDLYLFFEARPSSLVRMPANDKLFIMNKEELFNKLYDSLGSDEIYHDGRFSGSLGEIFKFSTTTMEDQGYYLFSIRNENSLRFIAANIGQTSNFESNESSLSHVIYDSLFELNYIEDKLIKLKNYYENHLI